MWNIKNLPPPPSSTIKIINKQTNLPEIRTLINDTLTLFNEQLHLKSEAQILGKFTRYRKCSYRRQPMWKSLQKLDKSLRNYQEMNFARDLYTFYHSIPASYKREEYFPGRNMLDYVLIRAQGVGKLFSRIYDCAEKVYTEGMVTVNRGHNLVVSILAVAISARIIILIRYMVQNLCKFYDGILPWRHHLGISKLEWLELGYEFPTKLQTWLDADWAFIDLSFTKIPEPKKLFASIDPNEVFEIDGEDVEFVKTYFDLTFDAPKGVRNDIIDVTNSGLAVLKPAKPKITTMSVIKIGNSQNDYIRVKDEILKIDEDEIGENSQLNTQNECLQIDVDEIGVPLNDDLKFREIRKSLDKCKKVQTVSRFVTNSDYFKVLPAEKYSEIVNILGCTNIDLMQKAISFKNKKVVTDLKNLVMMTAFGVPYEE